MTDVALKKPLKVEAGSLTAMVMVSTDALPQLREVLNKHGVRHWVRHSITKIGDSPPITWVHFYRETEAKAVQEILDSVI